MKTAREALVKLLIEKDELYQLISIDGDYEKRADEILLELSEVVVPTEDEISNIIHDLEETLELKKFGYITTFDNVGKKIVSSFERRLAKVIRAEVEGKLK